MMMRTQVLCVGLVACGGGGHEVQRTPAPPSPAAAQHGVRESSARSNQITVEGSLVHIQIHRADVALDTLSTVAGLGLPITGRGGISLDIMTPSGESAWDLHGGSGEITVTCSRCRIGDDRTKLQLPPAASGRTSSLAGDGLYFGHIDITSLRATFTLTRGHATLTAFTLDSPDLRIALDLEADVALNITRSLLRGCFHFAAKPALRERDPLTAALFDTTGAAMGTDGQYEIRFAGPWGAIKRYPGCAPASN